MSHLVVQELIENKIFIFRGHKVMLDKDLAELYGVTTKRLNEAVKRNSNRFPRDFMFQLDNKEVINLRSQFATSNNSSGGRRYNPYVFTEQGVAMLSSVLNSERAIQVNIAIMRIFVKIREALIVHKELAHKLSELEKRVENHDHEIEAIFEAIRQLMEIPKKSKRKIGFNQN